jgi:hypothetical protein
VTEKDVLAIRDGRLYELIDGVLVERSVRRMGLLFQPHIINTRFQNCSSRHTMIQRAWYTGRACTSARPGMFLESDGPIPGGLI